MVGAFSEMLSSVFTAVIDLVASMLMQEKLSSYNESPSFIKGALLLREPENPALN